MQLNSDSQTKKFVAERAEIQLPAGLIGLPELKRLNLIVDPEIYPIVVLRYAGEVPMDFLAVDPSVVISEYQLMVPDTDAAEIGITADGEPPLILNIVVVRKSEPKKVTVNLASPIIINRQTGVAKQVLLENAASYSSEHELTIDP